MPDPHTREPAAHLNRFTRLRWGIVILGIVAMGTFAASSGYDAWLAHGDACTANQREITHVAAALAEQTAWTIQGVDVVLNDTVRWYQNNRDRIPANRIDELLQSRAAGIPQIRMLTITDAQGSQLYRSRGEAPPGFDVSDREYFIAQRDGTVAGLFLSDPLLSRSVGRAGLILSRRLEDSAGRFDGVVTAIVELDDLARYYAAVTLAEGDAVQLLRDTGLLYVRNPATPHTVGVAFPQLLAPPARPDRQTTNPIDGTRVFKAIARVRDAPWMVVVTRDTGVALQVWHDEALRIATRTAWVLLLGMFAVATLWRQLTRIERVERARETLEAQLRQSQKIEALGTLAGGIAHDFNNILGAILGYGEMAQEAAGPEEPLHRYLDNVMQAATRAKALVKLILGFSRSRSGAGERLPVNMQSVVDEVLSLIAASLPNTIRLERRLAAGSAAVRGDSTHLHQVAMNLCTNALSAMEAGGRLTVSLYRAHHDAAPSFFRGSLVPGPCVCLAVEDTGAGMTPAVLDRMFDPFFTTRAVGEGTGLGLSLVYGIVTDLHGAIDVHSAPSHGTRFEIWLPVAGEVDAPAARAPAAAPRGHGETILVVDDERALVDVSEEMLAGLGYEPVGFTDSAGALAAFRARPQRFDLVLTDAAMPGSSGMDLVRHIRSSRPDIAVLLMTGHANPALAAEAAAQGITVLSKPLSRTELAAALAAALPTTAAASATAATAPPSVE